MKPPMKKRNLMNLVRSSMVALAAIPLLAMGLSAIGTEDPHSDTLDIATPLAFWNFAGEPQDWTKSPAVTTFRSTPEGLVVGATAIDPYLVGPEVSYPGLPFVTVTLRMRSSGDSSGQIFFGTTFSETDSRAFGVTADGEWHEYHVVLPALTGMNRLRLDPSHDGGDFTIAWIRVEASATAPIEAWASPRELRGKKFIAAGQYGAQGGATSVTSRFLAKNPDFLATFPYDGYVVPAVIDADWGEKLGLPRRDYFVHELLWNSVKLPYEALAPAIADLNSVRWGNVTDNFLNCTLLDGADGRFTPDLADDRDWAILEQNAALAARLCREAKLKGFWFDTEQYTNYRWRTKTGVPEYDPDKPQELKFPLGKDTPEVLRRRGAQWIKAVQAELPAVKIIITFAWSPDTNEYYMLKGANPFFDGVLDAIQAPAELIHGYENTFYYGHGPGTTHTQDGFPGGRQKFAWARSQMKAWRAFSSNPSKYDAFLKVGMAAWVEDDPWNVWDGFPSGHKASFWSNLPLALAYSDEYVWVWSEHTHYAHGFQRGEGVNPFLASLSNQTFNTGSEPVAAFTEDFASDPLRRGWYFDFDMLDIGRKKAPTHDVPLMSADAVPYVWSKAAKAVQIDGTWPEGPRQDAVAAPSQRRRYVRPIQPVSGKKNFHATLDFRIEAFDARPENPIVLGLFCSDQPLNLQSLTLQIGAPDLVHVVLTANGQVQDWPLSVRDGLKTDHTYRVMFDYDEATGLLQASLIAPSLGPSPVAQVQRIVPAATDSFAWDEFGIALWEAAQTGGTPTRQAYRYLLERAVLRP